MSPGGTRPRALLIAVSLAAFVLPLRIEAADKVQSIGVACLGRIIPEDGLFHLMAPYTFQGPSIIAELFVREGDHVKKDQVLAVTHSRGVAEAALAEAQSQVAVANARLSQVKAGEKATDIAAQEADVQRMTAEFENAERLYKRQVKLRRTGAVSDADFDQSHANCESWRNQLAAASKKLASMRDVRQTDVDYAAAVVEGADAAARRAAAELEQTHLRAPVDGQVIKIYAFPGEQAGSEGVLDLAKTHAMFVTAEVYETDVRRVKVKQRAEIEAEFLNPKVTGTVEEIGLAVAKNNLRNTDPAAFSDARIIEVKIRLDDSARVAGLIGAQVNVRILP